MTPKERVLTACRHQEPDRIPLQGYFTPEVYGQLEGYFAPRPVEEALGIDLRGVNALYTGPVGPSPLATGEAEQYDAWGVGYSAQANPSGGVYMGPAT